MAAAIVKGILNYQKITVPAVVPAITTTNKISGAKSAK
jgi:hypothetical protein